ncbi:hypothetical protein QL285_086244 [Trifolium repens]|nr:hypothetical protein QL285_086244 [Trifolium repens]
MSISINGTQHGFFNCTRGVRQGDPLSPLLFCLAEEVISRSVTKLVRDGKLTLIKGSRQMDVPSHILYADDIMLFCKASRSNIEALSNLFRNYAEASGQLVNPRKSFIYAGVVPPQRLQYFADHLGFNIGALPFVYLGAPIFKGKPKRSHLQAVADKVKSKLSAWKASQLSMAGRVQLIRSVIQGMMIHTISVYSWPSSLIKDVERWMRNFIWSGDVNQRKLVTVACHRVCTPCIEGGLGLRSLSKLNEATNLKLCWELFQSNLQWAKFLRHRVFKGPKPISYHIFSSIWSSVKSSLQDVYCNSSWQIGNGEDVNFWLDPWCGEPLVHSFAIPSQMQSSLKAKVKDFIKDQSWKIPNCLLLAYPDLQNLVDSIIIPLSPKDDKMLWKLSHDGDLSLKDAYSFYSPVGQVVNWGKLVWNAYIPPSKSMVIWRCLQHKLPTDDNLSLRGCLLPSMCSLCDSNIETHHHLFMNCNFATSIWNWLGSCLNANCQFSDVNEAFMLCNQNWSPLCNLVIAAAIINCVNFICFARNQRRFNDKKMHWKSVINLIIASVSLSGNNFGLKAKSNIAEFVLLQKFHVKMKHGNAPRIKEVLWQPPIFNWVKCNCDGASLGNPGLSSCGGIFRNSDALFLGAFSFNLGISSSLNAELVGAMIAIETAVNKGWSQLWLESDSMLVVKAFSSSKVVPWALRNRWDNCLARISNMNFFVSHIYREGNHCADKLAGLGLTLPGFTWWNQIPPQLRDDFGRNRLGMPFYRFC